MFDTELDFRTFWMQSKLAEEPHVAIRQVRYDIQLIFAKFSYHTSSWLKNCMYDRIFN